MTLVLNAGIGGLFVIMTSDFRRTLAERHIDYEKLSISNYETAEKTKSTDGKPKVYRLTDKVMAATGGIESPGKYVLDQLKKRVKTHHDLTDCKAILELVLFKCRAENKIFHVNEAVSLLMSGFYNDGSIGYAGFISGEEVDVFEQKAAADEYLYNMITPDKKYLENIPELFTIPEIFDEEKSFLNNVHPSELSNKILKMMTEHLKKIHSYIAGQHTVDVSPGMSVHLIAFNKGRYDYDHVSYNLIEPYKQLESMKQKVR
ncbi:hypothetical protein [Lentibacillus saliphilus]|uniref:hypothetical protein n=1 Tax=Lentibacillus saliphilus TaxID=2737028 RepID=UPI001C30D258|nr:hypothetical protein [Lentibacillus saliphilus]